ncbi:MAG TPA: LPXTG cell wall anchor domain-containing protein, partial [Actinoplanes sp.]|nr:LPXTG cell wall anchor domain-containing protein [Actinoplanes sp.]
AVEALSDCDGNVNLKLINRSTASEKFTITADGGFNKTQTLAVRAEPVTVTIPAANAKNIVVTSRGKELYRGEWTKPADCNVPAEGAVATTCDGLSFVVKNPQDGTDVNVTFTPGNGEPRTVTAAPGETKTIAFPGSEGLVVTVTGDVPALNGEHKWTKPADCGGGEEPSTPAEPSPSVSTPAEPSPSVSTPAESPSASVSTTPVSGNDEDPELPLTGSAAAGIAGGAFLLLVAGAVLFILARRRKVNFTA